MLFRVVRETLLEVAADPRHLGAKIGGQMVLHTWGQTLQPHPHRSSAVTFNGPLQPMAHTWAAAELIRFVRAAEVASKLTY